MLQDFIVVFNYASDHFPSSKINGKVVKRGFPISAQDKRLAGIHFTAQMDNDDLKHFVVDVEVKLRSEAPPNLLWYRPSYDTLVLAANNIRPRTRTG